MGDRKPSEIAREAGLRPQMIDKYLKGTMPGADRALALADALGVSFRWLIRGEGEARESGVENDPADWRHVPKLNLADFTDEAKPEPMEMIWLHRDWLGRRAWSARNLWLTAMPATFMDGGYEEGEPVLCQDATVPDGEGTYLYLADGVPLVRRLVIDAFAPSGLSAGDRAWHVPPDEGGPRLVARILGAINLRPK